MRQKKRKKAARQMIIMAIAVVFALAVLIVLACAQAFTVRDVIVVGNRNLPSEAVIAQSGVRTGENRLAITRQRLSGALEKNRYIQYAGHEFDYRGTLTLYIKERIGRAVIRSLGYYFVMDETGMVLECAGSEYPQGVAGPKITGLSIVPNARINAGERLPVESEQQLQAMEQILVALDQTGFLGRISEVSVKNLENLYLLTAEGAKIELGTSDELQTKMLIGCEVLSIREEEGALQGAKIDVSNGYNAHYIPAVLPTVTPVPTTTPTPAPTAKP